MEALQFSTNIVSNILKRKFDDILVYFIVINLLTGITSTQLDASVNCNNSVYEILSRKSLILQPSTEENKFPNNIPEVTIEPLQAQAASKRIQRLSLENLFPEINVTSTPANFNLKSPILNNRHSESRTPNKINLTSVLLNHGFNDKNLNSETSEALDRFVFSNLPQGSKLVLKTVKIVRTDDDGNEESMGDPAVTLNVSPIGNLSVDPEEHAEAEDDSDDSESEEEEVQETKDLASEATHHSKTGSSYAGLDKEKDKSEKYHLGQKYGNDHKQVLTDTQGKKVTNYKGHEKGVTDFDNEHGNAQSNDGERFKKSKKKNKGRKVTGFKRVYHKEEYQRTEHFYDDEEAKKIAESYGLANANEKKEHGKKDDHRKYHGARVEHEDGKKVKNEHATHQGHNKGHHVVHGHNDKYKQSQHQSSHHQTPQYGHQQQQHHTPQYQHPNHNYKGAYSNPKPKYDPRPPLAPPPPANKIPANNRRPTRGPPIPIAFSPALNSESNSEVEEPSEEESDELRTYHAERNRTPANYYYAPNFGPPPSIDNLTDISDNENAPYRRHHNTTGIIFVTTPKMKMNEDDRYAQKFPSPKPLLFESVPKTNPPPYHSVPYYPAPPGKNLLGIDKAIITQVASEIYRESPPLSNQGIFFNANARKHNWNPISSGSSITGQVLSSKGTNNSIAESLPIPSSVVQEFNKLGNLSSVENATAFYDSIFKLHSPEPEHASYPSYPPKSVQDTRSQRLIPYIRFRSNNEGEPSNSPPIPNLPINNKFYYGPTLIQHSDKPPSLSTHTPPTYSRRGPGTFSNFMNGLMNSVSDFFTRIG